MYHEPENGEQSLWSFISVQGSRQQHAANSISAERLTAAWSATPVGVRAGFLELLQHGQEQQQEIEQLRAQLHALASEVASLRARIGRSSRNSAKPPSSDGPGHRCAEALRATSQLSGVTVVGVSLLLHQHLR